MLLNGLGFVSAPLYLFGKFFQGKATEQLLGKGVKPEPGVIEITYGYSRDHRPDLKQLMMNLICVGDGDIPVLMEIASGNQSDKVRFAQLFQELREQWTFEGLCVADGALYSADNLTAMTG